MLTTIKQGLYSDTVVLFNNDTLNLHTNYLKLVSSYFEQNVSNTHKITYTDINNELLNGNIFTDTINMLYDGKFDFSLYNIFDLIEMFRLWRHFGFYFIDSNNESCLNRIKEKIYEHVNEYNGLVIGLSCNNFTLTYNKIKNRLVLNYNNKNAIFNLSEIKKYDSDTYPDYKYTIRSPKSFHEIFFSSDGKIFYHYCNKQLMFNANLDIDYIIKNNKIIDKKYTFNQSYFLLNLLIDNNESVHKKIISQMEISVENISKYPKKVHKLICKEFSERENGDTKTSVEESDTLSDEESKEKNGDTKTSVEESDTLSDEESKEKNETEVQKKRRSKSKKTPNGKGTGKKKLKPSSQNTEYSSRDAEKWHDFTRVHEYMSRAAAEWNKYKKKNGIITSVSVLKK